MSRVVPLMGTGYNMVSGFNVDLEEVGEEVAFSQPVL